MTFMTLGGADVEEDFDRRTGFMIGGFAQLDFVGPFALQPEVLYIQKGASQEADVQGTTLTGTTKLDYIEIPVLVKFQLPVGGVFSPNLIAGPTLGFNVTAEAELEGGGQSETEDVSDSVSTTDFGLALGAGADFGLVVGTLSVDLRYGFSLASIDDTEEDQSVRNRGFMITAGFAF